jgi:hypothetical protein
MVELLWLDCSNPPFVPIGTVVALLNSDRVLRADELVPCADNEETPLDATDVDRGSEDALVERMRGISLSELGAAAAMDGVGSARLLLPTR